MAHPVDAWVDAAVQALAAKQQPWQSQYADPNWQQKLTKLSPEEESRFQQWANTTKAPITDDYDMRGYWKSGAAPTQINPNDGLPHFTDHWKTPLHQSFSGESVYSRNDIPKPTWNKKNQLVAPDGTVLFDESAQNGRK